ncbi:MAG: glycosyltransferase family 4 protein [Mesorhizobium sp.]|nr:glycosyltransferase family 4 protein [Mesorhizobium sp.]
MKDPRARILVLTYTPFAREPRALKQVKYLKATHDVTTAGFGPSPFPDVPHVELPELPPQRWALFGRLLNLGLLVLHWYWPLSWINALDRATVRMLAGDSWDVVIAHDLKVLEASLELKPRYGVVLDLHEYAPRQNEHSFIWRLLIAPYYRWLCRRRAPRAAAVVTVSQGIVDEYRRVFGIESTLVVNATPYQEMTPSAVGAPLRLVHSGGIAVQRRLDIMIQGVRESSADVTLDFYLVGGESALMAHLKSLASGDPRIRFREPVPYRDLIRVLNRYDIGLSIFPPTTFNLAWCLPNKFFDFVQARLGVIVGPSPEMARFVNQYGIGLVLPDFEPASLAAALDSLTSDRVAAWKVASDANASTMSSESQAEIWEDLVSRVLAERPRKA